MSVHIGIAIAFQTEFFRYLYNSKARRGGSDDLMDGNKGISHDGQKEWSCFLDIHTISELNGRGRGLY